jgi:hypothetical protein
MKKLSDGERMAVIETDIKYIKEKMDKFIDTADTKYATKEELCTVKDTIKDHSKTSQTWIMAVVPWVFAAINLVILIFVSLKDKIFGG